MEPTAKRCRILSIANSCRPDDGGGDRRLLLLPHPIPPLPRLLRRVGPRLLAAHLPVDPAQIPAGQVRQSLGFLRAAVPYLTPIVADSVAFALAAEGVMDHEPPLKIGAVARFLEEQVLGKVPRVIADVEAGNEQLLPGSPPDALRRARGDDTLLSGRRDARV